MGDCGDLQEFDFDDRDQELIDALAGNFAKNEDNLCESDDSMNNNDPDDQGDPDDDNDHLDIDWDDDDDYGIVVDEDMNEPGEKDEDDDTIIESLKDEINATKAKLIQLEARLAEHEKCKKQKLQQNTKKKVTQGSDGTGEGAKQAKGKRSMARDASKEKESSHKSLREKNDQNLKLSKEKKAEKKEQKFENHPTAKKMMDEKKSTENENASMKCEDANSLFKKKDRLAHAPKREPKMDRSGIDNVNYEKKKIQIDKKPNPKQQPKEDERVWRTEAYSGIRIINPCVSSTQMESRMEGRRFMKLNTLSRYIVKGEITGDWVTMAVVVGKLPPKTAANGKTFSIWKLSDLVVGHENETTSFFLFGDTHKEHWKTSEGTVVALLNASIMPQRDNDSVGTVAITIDNPKKLMIMGISKDFGICKGFTRRGNQCSNIVNKVHGDYCEYHVTREHKKAMAGRMELQLSATGPDLKKGKRMQSVKKDISSGQVCYGGQTLTWSDKGEKKKKADTKKSILNTMAGSFPNESQKLKNVDAAAGRSSFEDDHDSLSEDFKSRLKVPTLGSRNLLKFLKKDEEDENQKQAAVKPEVKSAKDLIIEQKENNKKGFKPINLNLTSTSTLKKPTPRFSANFKPTIGGSSIDDDYIEFCDSDDVVSDALNSKSSCALSDTPKLKKKSPGTNRPVNNNQAKLKAISLVRNNKVKIDQEEDDKNDMEKSQRKAEKIKERVMKDISNDSEEAQPPKKKRKGILGEIFGELDLESEEGKKLIAMKSKNEHLVRLAEVEREQAYFNVLEKKEMYEDKMKAVMELKVTAICCKTCKYMHEFQSNFCKDNSYMIIKVDATKRFFFCKNCKNRTTSLKKFPVQPCRNCGSNNFERTSMFQEKKGPKIGGETLLVRGEEHSLFLNNLK